MTVTSLTKKSASADWSAIDAGLAELECLAANENSVARFYATVCEWLVKWQLPASSLWSVEAKGPPRLLGSTAGNVVVSPEQVAGWLEGREIHAANGLFVPWKLDGIVAGGIFAGPEKSSSAETESVSQLLSAVAELCALFHSHAARRESRQRFEQQEQWHKSLRQLNASLDLTQTAFLVANEGRTLIGCDRVSVAIRHGNSYRLLAVSGAEHVHRRAESVRALERLAATVVSFGQAVWHTGSSEDSPPQVQAAVDVYLEESPATAVGLLPLATAERPLAVLVVEQFTGIFTAEHRAAADWLAVSALPAIQRNWQLQGIPLLKFWLAWQQAASRNHWLSRGSLAAISVTVILAALFVIPAEIEVRATGELQPTKRHEVFAPRDGVVTKILVDHGSVVDAEEKLLELRSPEFDLELQRVVGEMDTTHKQLDAVRAERLQNRSGDAEARLKQRRLTADEEQFQEQIRGLETRRELLRQQQAELTLKSPAAGEVITWNVKQRLSQRPLRRGDALLTVADLRGGWQLELRLPTRRAGRLLTASAAADREHDVAFTLNSRPGVTFHGRVTEVSRRVELTETGESYVLLKGTVAEKELPELTPGTAVSARIACGRGSLGVAWFHELIDAGRWWLTW